MRVTLKIWRQPDSASPGAMATPVLHKEELTYEFVEMKQRSYK